MSPKSRGRPKGRGRKGKARASRTRPERPVNPVDEIVQQAASLVHEEDAVLAETWASGWLGRMWQAATRLPDDRLPEYWADLDDEDRFDPAEAEVALVTALVQRVLHRPSAAGLAALHAFGRVASDEATEPLTEAIAELSATLPEPAFSAAPAAVPSRAWTAVDVWGAERLIFVEFEQPTVHTLVAQVLDVGGRLVESLALALGPGVAQDWAGHRAPDDVPMEPVETPVEVALTDLADALAASELLGATDDDWFAELRALAWARSIDYATAPQQRAALDVEERERLRAAFVAEADVPDTPATAALVDLFLDFGETFLREPLAWSPLAVAVLLEEALPGQVHLEDDARDLLPDVLRAWIRFSLARVGVEERWVQPVVDAVEPGMAVYHEVTARMTELEADLGGAIGAPDEEDLAWDDDPDDERWDDEVWDDEGWGQDGRGEGRQD
ncbi:hypothetical protein HJG43_06110 [Kineosporiaceae bacterium SCSIO 59966]|nr:hypothetical protein HJG43_06110 [Kineosporiaceae bacterium SCSIO 59966]